MKNLLLNPLAQPESSFFHQLSHYAGVIFCSTAVFFAIMIVVFIVKFVTASDDKKEGTRNWLAFFVYCVIAMMAIAFFQKFAVPYLFENYSEQTSYRVIISCGVACIIGIILFANSQFFRNLEGTGAELFGSSKKGQLLKLIFSTISITVIFWCGGAWGAYQLIALGGSYVLPGVWLVFTTFFFFKTIRDIKVDNHFLEDVVTMVKVVSVTVGMVVFEFAYVAYRHIISNGSISSGEASQFVKVLLITQVIVTTVVVLAMIHYIRLRGLEK